MNAVLRARVETLAVDEGFWCRACRLPSGARVWFTVTIDSRTVLRSTLTCRDCHGTDVDAV